MSVRRHKREAGPLRRSAPVFAALGDSTRLRILASLAAGRSLSIARLTEGTTVTRQAITKHLGVLEHAGLVRSVRRGRENRFELEPEPLAQARCALDTISRRWDEALARLRALVEE
jgi:DNA-binding transcriptional ArsR family regulator